MAAYVFVTRNEDVVDSLNDAIERAYPGNNFDFSGYGLPSEWVSKIHNEGFSVKAVHTQADSGDWGTFIQVEKDFEIEEPENDVSDSEWNAYESNLEKLDEAIQDWAKKFAAEIR